MVLGVIVGFTRGDGDRAHTFGALQIAAFRKGKLRYLGKVGTGFSDASLREIGQSLEKLRTGQRPITEKVEDEARTIWVIPEIVCQLSYSRQNEKAMREPVFMKLRPDLSPEDCREEEQER
jgi:bifunctional non-homologous end joining protein LigD